MPQAMKLPALLTQTRSSDRRAWSRRIAALHRQHIRRQRLVRFHKIRHQLLRRNRDGGLRGKIARRNPQPSKYLPPCTEIIRLRKPRAASVFFPLVDDEFFGRHDIHHAINQLLRNPVFPGPAEYSGQPLVVLRPEPMDHESEAAARRTLLVVILACLPGAVAG